MILRLALLTIQWLLYAFLSGNLEDRYSSTGIGYSSPSLLAVVLSLGGLALVAAFLRSATSLPSDGALWLLASFVVVPTWVVAAVNPFFSDATSTTASIVVLVGFMVPAIMVRTRRRPKAAPDSGPMTRRAFVAVVLAMALMGIATVVLGYGVSAVDLGLNDVYDRRLNARQVASPYPGAEYLVSWLKIVLAPLLVALSIEWRIRWLGLLSLLIVLVIFSFSGEKAAFVYPLIAVAVIVSARLGRNAFPAFGALLTFGVIGFSVVVGRLWPESLLDVFVARRFGLVPGILTHSYVDFAGSQGFTFYAQSWLRPFSYGPETLPLGPRVGALLVPDGGLNANANLWADGYASAGLFGVVIAGGLLLIILRLMDGVALSRDRVVATATLTAVSFSYVNGYFHTSLLTGGVIFGLLLVWAMPAATKAPVEARPPKASRGEVAFAETRRPSVWSREVT